MQKIEFIGNLTATPETKTTKNGKSVCMFSVAVNDGGSVDFFRVSVWEKLGEVCQKYLDKGKKVFVAGKLKARLYESKGKSCLSLDVVATEIEFLTPKGAAESASVQNGAVVSDDSFTDINPNYLPF